LQFKNKLICGSWNGEIYVIGITDFAIEKTLKHHNRSVMKIANYKDNIFLSSSLDKTIKKWKLN
jgi:WD40 repeat protein